MTIAIEHPILDRKVVELKARIKESITAKKMEIIHLEAKETTWGELADHVSAMIEVEKRHLAKLEARL